MTSLYGRLFHASSAHRERLEDYLTEVLGDLLNRISKEQVRAFCLEFLFDGIASELKAQWVMLFDRPGDVTWDTQEWISVDGAEKRPDLILYQETTRVAITTITLPTDERHFLSLNAKLEHHSRLDN